jgi:hypothetical protein
VLGIDSSLEKFRRHPLGRLGIRISRKTSALSTLAGLIYVSNSRSLFLTTTQFSDKTIGYEGGMEAVSSAGNYIFTRPINLKSIDGKSLDYSGQTRLTLDPSTRFGSPVRINHGSTHARAYRTSHNAIKVERDGKLLAYLPVTPSIYIGKSLTEPENAIVLAVLGSGLVHYIRLGTFLIISNWPMPLRRGTLVPSRTRKRWIAESPFHA